MPKKVLIVSYSFPPSNAPAAQRAYSFAKYLPQFDITPIVLTTTKNISSLGYGNSMDTNGMWLIDTSANKQTVKSSERTSKNIVKNNWLKKVLVQLMIPDRGIIWLPAALKHGSKFLKTNKDVSCIFATAPSFTNLLIALILAKRFNKKLICDFRDFYVEKGLFKRIFPLSLLDKWLEKVIVKKATRLIFISKSMKQVYENAYPFIKNKSALIYNGFDDDEFLGFKNAISTNEKKLKIFFAGSLYFESTHPRNIFLLLDIIQLLIEEKKVDADKIEIKTAAFIHPVLLNKLIHHKLFSKINLLGVIKREEVLKEMQQANLLWHILGNSEQDKCAIPIKTFEYMAANKQVIFFVPQNSELEEIAREYQLGYVCYLDNKFENHNQQVFLDAYNHLTQSDFVNKNVGSNKAEDRFKKFKRSFQAQQLAEIIKQINSKNAIV